MKSIATTLFCAFCFLLCFDILGIFALPEYKIGKRKQKAAKKIRKKNIERD